MPSKGPRKDLERRRFKRVSEADRERFLEGLRLGLTKARAAEAASHPPETFYALCRREPEFKKLADEALEIGTDLLEEEMWRRSVEGFDEPIIGKVAPGIDGQLRDDDGNPLFVRRYSDRLAEVLLKGRRPEYREKQGVTIDQRSLTVNVEDRSAALADVARVLAEAGVDVGKIGAGNNGGGGVIEGVPSARRLLAES